MLFSAEHEDVRILGNQTIDFKLAGMQMRSNCCAR